MINGPTPPRRLTGARRLRISGGGKNKGASRRLSGVLDGESNPKRGQESEDVGWNFAVPLPCLNQERVCFLFFRGLNSKETKLS